MPFGASLGAAPSEEPGDWIRPLLEVGGWTVGSLIPAGYESIVRIFAPEPSIPDDWWNDYLAVFDAIASVGARHTTTPHWAWYAIWEGHGFDRSTMSVAWREPPADEAERQEREAYREQLRAEGRERDAALARALATIPRLEMPARSHYLLNGSLEAVSHVRYPNTDGWKNPDVFWPDDRAWFAATDVDFWSIFVGGSVEFTDELIGSCPTPCVRVEPDARLPIED